MTTTAEELFKRSKENGQVIKKLIASTPYIPPASVTVPVASNVQTPPIPQGGQE